MMMHSPLTLVPVAALPLVEDQNSVYNEGMKRAAWITGLLVFIMTATSCNNGGDGGTAGAGGTSELPGKIAFFAFRDGNSEVYVMDLDGTNQVNLTNNAVRDWQPAFSPDGSKIKRKK